MTDKILIDKSVLQQAQAVLENADTCVYTADLRPVINALRAALAAPQPAQPAEPIGVVATNPILNTIGSAYVVRVLVGMPDAVRVGDKLYTAPPPAQLAEPVAWAISYDGQTPYRLWHEGDGPLLDLEIRRIGGTAKKLAIYTDAPPAQPAEPVSTWCDGCSPENCVGCHIPSDATAPAQTVAEPTREFLERTLAAMEGVIDVADRKTAEFDALRSCVIDLTLMLFKPTTRPAPPAIEAARGTGSEKP